MTFSDSVAFDTELHGVDVCIAFTRETIVSHDPHYGADADGRRGMPMTFIDEDRATAITITVGDSRFPIPLDWWPEPAQGAVRQAVEAYLETHEPEPPEDHDDADRDDEDDDEEFDDDAA